MNIHMLLLKSDDCHISKDCLGLMNNEHFEQLKGPKH